MSVFDIVFALHRTLHPGEKRLLEIIARGEALSPQTSAEMVHLMARQQVRNRIPVLIPDEATVANGCMQVLDAGPMVLPEHQQNLPVLGDVEGLVKDLPWSSAPQLGFAGLRVMLGGRTCSRAARAPIVSSPSRFNPHSTARAVRLRSLPGCPSRTSRRRRRITEKRSSDVRSASRREDWTRDMCLV